MGPPDSRIKDDAIPEWLLSEQQAERPNGTQVTQQVQTFLRGSPQAQVISVQQACSDHPTGKTTWHPFQKAEGNQMRCGNRHPWYQTAFWLAKVLQDSFHWIHLWSSRQGFMHAFHIYHAYACHRLPGDTGFSEVLTECRGLNSRENSRERKCKTIGRDR